MLRTIAFFVAILVVATNSFAQIEWIENPVAADYDGAWGIYAVDMDGDEDIDLVTSAYEADEVTWWENDGNQQFLKHTIDTDLDGATSVHAGDLDADGDMDIIGVSYRGDEIARYENDGQMGFTKYILVQNYSRPLFARMHDVDGDNDMDIVGSNWGYGDITWWENTGYPNFTRHDIDSTFDGCRHLDVSDLDNDGDNDILVSSASINQISWYENDGSQVFQKNFIYGVYKTFWAKPYDFNGDGAWDLLGCSGDYMDDISWFENDGNMNFTKHTIDISIDDPQSVEAADFDLDGDLDIVCASRNDNEIAWWENQNNTVFTKHSIISGYYYPVMVFPVDIEADGDFDVITTAYGGDSLTWWDNRTIFIPGIINGTVVDEYSIPIEDVYVYASGTDVSDFTDTGGQYELAVLGGTYDIGFEKTGYYDYIAHDISISLEETVSVDATLLGIPQPCSSCVRGVLTNREAIEIENVFVSAIGTGVNDYTNAAGRYSLEGLASGNHDIFFSHPAYSDTTVMDVFSTPDSGTTLDMLLESNSAITGVVVDTNAQPISGTAVNIFDINLATFTDSLGEFIMPGLVPGFVYDISFTHEEFDEYIVEDIAVGANETLDLGIIYLQPHYYEVIVWYGNLDLSPVTAPIGDTIMIDLYVQSAPYLNLNFLNLPLATDDQYIIDHHSVEQGVLYYPLTDWDDVQFLPPTYLMPGWHNQTLLGFSDLGGPLNPYLACPEPTRIASFAFEVANDISLIGDTLVCLMAGDDPAGGGPLFGDSTGIDPYYPYQLFSPLYFVEPNLTEIDVWYGNPDSSLITASIGDTILVDVYVQSSGYLNFDSLHLALAVDDQYIEDYLSDTAGALYYPLAEWDNVQFLPPNVLSPGWHSQSLYGVADTGGDPNPYLQCSAPVRIASFALEIVNDISIIGDTATCLTAGLHPVYGGSFMDDSADSGPYYPSQFFSSLYFIGSPSGGCEYVVGDVNSSGDFNGLDVTFGVSYFKGGAPPPYECECTPGNTWFVAGDVNGSCNYNGLDITFAVAYFKGGAAPVPCADCPPVE